MNKSSLKNFAIAARLELLQRVADRARIYGIDEKNSKAGAIQPSSGFQKLGGALLSAEETAQRNALIGRVYAHGYRQTMEEAAYTWFNRFIAIRYMQTHNRLPVPMRVFPDAPGVQPQMLSAAQDVDLPGVDAGQVLAMLDSNQTDALYKYLLIALCNHLAEPLPRMFETISDSTELLFPDGLLKADSVLGQMAELAEDNWQDIQVIGWLYQYYISQRHDEVVDINGSAIAKEDIPAATCLYTTDWVVRYMVENSIGRLWLEGHPSDNLRMGWRYYMEEAQQTPQVAAQLAELRAPYRQMQPEQLTLLDPCMGSGHILVYAFDVLMDIYRSVGYTDRDAVQSIVQNNLYGLDIDDRAAQLAYFAVMMKACDYDRRFLRRGVQPNVYAIAESGPVEAPLLDAFGAEKPLAQRLLRTFANAKEFGSILHVDFTPQELARLRSRLDNMQHAPETSLTSMADSAAAVAAIEPLLQPAEILVGRYDTVVTNPPYMNKFSANMKGYVQENFADYKADLFAVFMHRNFDFCKENGYSAFMTPFVWMFIKSYEKLREEIIAQKCISTLIQMEYSAFEEATVPICSFVLRNSKLNYKGNYLRLSDFKGGMDVQNEKVLEAQNDPACKYRYTTQQENFTKIPGCPVAYWVGEKLVDIFTKGEMLEVHSTVFEGLKTRDKERFVRLWHEIDKPNWKPYAKGGTFRRWYGNNEYVVDWGKNGDAIRAFPKSSGANFKYYNVPTVTYSALTSYKFSGRYIHESIFGGGGGGITNSSEIEVILAFVNSIVFHYMINAISPTLNFEVGQIGQQPLIIDSRYKELIITLAKANIELSRNDWDSFETSWDFKKHPLL